MKTEEQKAASRARYAANRDRMRAYHRAWKLVNKEKTKAYARKYGVVNAEKEKLRKLRYREANREKCLAAGRAYRRANRDKLRAAGRVYWAAKGPEKSRNVYVRRMYGLFPGEEKAMLISQGGRCASCARLFTDDLSPKVDHNHTTKQVRELLCHGCNVAAGFLDEDPIRCDALAAYLRKHAPPAQ